MRDYRFRPPREPLAKRQAQTWRPSRWVRPLASLAPIVVAGSGLLNLLSLIGGPLPNEQPRLVKGLFPLDFSHISHVATLLLGFGLILTAVHLTARKKRALYLGLALCLASAIYHLTKSWELEEAVCSLGVGAVLFAVRRAFRIGSGRPDLLVALKRAAVALSVAGVYGAAGFWLLEPREFGRNFHWWEAAARTIQVMLLVPDSGLSPRTPHAAWFLESLYILSGMAFLYCGVTLFRPVAYRFRQNDDDRDLARKIAEAHARSGQDFFKQWPDKSFFFSRSRRSFIAYRVANHFALVLGDPVGPEEEIQSTVEQFVDFCQQRGWRVGFHQVEGDRLGLYRSLGFHHLRIGDDAVVKLGSFSLKGSAMKEFRNTVNRLDRMGYQVKRFDPPVDGNVLEELRRVSDEWLTIPGHRERRFTLGRFEAAYVSSTRVYAAVDENGKAAAFLNLVPSYRPGLATVDLMRRRRESINGVMDYLFAKVFLALAEEGFDLLSLGMAPGAVFNDGETSTVEEKAVSWAMRHFPSVFRSESLRRFKAKYAHHWEPRYAIYRSRWDLPRLALALRRISEDGKELRRAA